MNIYTINITTTFIIIILGIIFSKLLGNIIKRIIKESKTDQIIQKKIGINLKLNKRLSLLIQYLIYLITLILVLKQLGITLGLLQRFGLVLIIILITLIVLAFKETLPNIIFGLYFKLINKYKKGSKLNYQNVSGNIIKQTLLETKIRTKKNEILSIPNSVLIFNKK